MYIEQLDKKKKMRRIRLWVLNATTTDLPIQFTLIKLSQKLKVQEYKISIYL